MIPPRPNNSICQECGNPTFGRLCAACKGELPLNLNSIPPRKIPEGFIKIQPNRLFDSEEELMSVYPQCKIVRRWQCAQFHYEILVQSKSETKSKKK